MNKLVRRPSRLLVLSLLLAGCGSSPPATYHTLTRAAGDPARLAGVERGYGVMVGPVSVPEVVNRPQLVIRNMVGQVELREQQRWASALTADIAQALTENLSVRLPEAHVYSQLRSPANVVPPRFRLAVDLQRFESSLQGEQAGSLLEADWVLTEVASGHRMVCRSQARAALQGGGYDGLVAAHQAALAVLGERMAVVLAARARTQAAVMPADTICQR